MSTIRIHRGHDLSVEQARATVRDVADAMARKYATRTSWQGEDRLAFHRPGIDGQIRLEHGQILVHARLGLLFAAMKPIIKREIERTLDQHFSD